MRPHEIPATKLEKLVDIIDLAQQLEILGKAYLPVVENFLSGFLSEKGNRHELTPPILAQFLQSAANVNWKGFRKTLKVIAKFVACNKVLHDRGTEARRLNRVQHIPVFLFEQQFAADKEFANLVTKEVTAMIATSRSGFEYGGRDIFIDPFDKVKTFDLRWI